MPVPEPSPAAEKPDHRLHDPLLPPLAETKGKKAGPAEGEEGGDVEPTAADARALLESNLFNHALITDDEVALRLRMSSGKNFRAFQARKDRKSTRLNSSH